jgi:hypothetical protein
MSKITRILFFIAFSLFGTAQTQNLLSGKYKADQIKTILIPRAEWTPFPKITDRTAWSKADESMMKVFFEKGLGYINYDWPSKPATTSLQIERTGDRATSDGINSRKREVLGTLVLAEIYENKGRFTDAIVNGVWSVCEQSWWGSPAHLPKTKELSGLIDVSQPFVELFGAEMSTFLAWVDYFIGDKLDAVSPQLRKRMYAEVNRRVFEPLMTKPHGWMAKNANGRRPNNWNPWICSNWLNAVLLLEKDDSKRVNAVAKILTVLDEFLNPYPADGGCDEGPGYWGAAGASLYDNISMLNLATNNAFKYVYDDEKIKNMGRYIYRANIGPVYFVNFADASPKPGMAASMIYRFGKDIHDSDMMRFGAYYRKEGASETGGHYFRTLFELFMQDEFKNAVKGLPLPANVWLPDLQVMAARDKQASADGWFIAAKGGNNDESHNHNDVGNYMVYYNGLPLLIDVGSGTYTAKTFSSKRYDIWSNCSNYHNLPDINGETQPPGAQYKAGAVTYKQDKNSAEFSLDIAGAYAEKAGLISLQRTVRLNRGKNVLVSDLITQKTGGSITEHIMTCYPANLETPGNLVIHYKADGDQAQDFVIKYDAKQLQAGVEKIALTAPEDKGVIRNWGDNIYRISFATNSKSTKTKIEFVVSKK